MDALQETVARTWASRGEDTEADVHEMPKPRNKAVPRMTANLAARKPAAKETAGRKPKRRA
ncbi:hypothetical protein JIX56_00905 [Streptomyces sp. CA-210063]|uniref:hypothetical protein n=1 Tax=Streptomyces sp. CA-210063 TaxID=2801029 RepID=UPI00214C20C4|nr:hypothetical protein [Streptomyces sp. CA-210063]UUU28574.1 hypothetical protein JIX56_00905 [Streptomyces sp. CA-210063]